MERPKQSWACSVCFALFSVYSVAKHHKICSGTLLLYNSTSGGPTLHNLWKIHICPHPQMEMPRCSLDSFFLSLSQRCWCKKQRDWFQILAEQRHFSVLDCKIRLTHFTRYTAYCYFHQLRLFAAADDVWWTSPWVMECKLRWNLTKSWVAVTHGVEQVVQ